MDALTAISAAHRAARAGRTADARELVDKLRRIPAPTPDLRAALILLDAWCGGPRIADANGLASRLQAEQPGKAR